jgi:hypothetical protein
MIAAHTTVCNEDKATTVTIDAFRRRSQCKDMDHTIIVCYSHST